MIIQTSYNLNFAIFPDEKFDQEKIISERLNKTPNFENTNHKLFLNQNHKETIFNDEFEQSGYYLYDEQFLRLNGVRHYRLTLFNAILKVPVTERIVCRRILKNTKKFILDSTKNKPLICLTTDLFPMYRNVVDEIGVNHQLCIFHLFQTINHKLKGYCRRNKINKNKKNISMKMRKN